MTIDQDDIIQVKRSTLRLVDAQCFLQYVSNIAGGTMSYKQAYDIAEAEYHAVFGVRRYKSYEIFRQIKSRHAHRRAHSCQLAFF